MKEEKTIWQKIPSLVAKFGTTGLILVTVGLVITTWMYTSETKKMVEITEKQFNLNYEQFQQNNRPYLFIEKLKFNISEKGEIHLSGLLRNTGKVPAKVNFKEVCFTVENNENCLSDPEKVNDYYYIYPDSEGKSFLLINESEKVENLFASKKFLNMASKINYWSMSDEKMKKKFFYINYAQIIQDPKDSSKFITIDVNTVAN